MKKHIVLIISLFMIIYCFGQNNTKKDQLKNSIIITDIAFGPFKLDQSLQDVEKIVGKKVKYKINETGLHDIILPIDIKYKGAKLHLDFLTTVNQEDNPISYYASMKLISITSASKNIITDKGIVVGSMLKDIQEKYSQGNSLNVKNKKMDYVINGTNLNFKLSNNKVTNIEIIDISSIVEN